MRKSVHYYGLDLLRLGAAGLVIADHFGAYGWSAPTTAAQGEALAFPFLNGMESIGSIGVEIFFLISGFVIAASAVGSTASRFLLSRAIRVFPALWICGLIAFGARALAGEPPGALLGFFLRSASLSPVGPYIDGVVWTLVVEAVFYALVFFMLLSGGFARMDVVAKGLGALSAAFLTIYALATLLAGSDPHLATLAALCGRFPFKVFLLRHGVFFAVGMLLWSGFASGFTPARLRLMALFSLFASIEIAIDRGGMAEVAMALGLWWGAFALIVVSVAARERIAAVLSRWGRPIQDLGRLSYPLYLNHYVLGMVLVPALFALHLPRGAVLALTLAIVVASSWLVMAYPERLAQRWLRSRLLGRSPAPAGDVQRSPALVR